ncbi:MAG: ABC transporter permease [Acidobacteriota bacterium]
MKFGVRRPGAALARGGLAPRSATQHDSLLLADLYRVRVATCRNELAPETSTNSDSCLQRAWRQAATSQSADKAAHSKEGPPGAIGNNIMETLFKEIRYGIRSLFKHPGFTAIAVITLALGIGANTAMFSVINAVLLRPLPYRDPARLVTIWEESPERDMYEMPVSLANLRDWVDQNQTFEQISAYTFTNLNLTGTGEPARLSAVRANANLFPLVGVTPVIGRPFLPEEDKEGAHRVVILGHALWQSRFGGDPAIVSKSLTLDNQSHTVVGVMSANSQFPVGFGYMGKVLNDPIDIYVPLAASARETERGSYSFFAIGRLKPGVAFEQARAEMTTIEKRLELQYPDGNTGIGISLVPTQEQTVKEIRPALLVLLGAVAFMLLIACANIANLQLARAASRQKEMAIRTALGASRLRVLRLLLTESLMLSLTGGGLGLLLAVWGADALMALGPDNIPRMNEVGVDARVFGFTLAVSIVTGIIFGLIPGLQAARPNLNEGLKEGSKGSMGSSAGKRTRNVLVAVEVALSLVLLIGAGLMIKSFIRLQQTSLGFNPDDVLAVSLTLSDSRYPEDRQQAAFFQQALERIQSLNGVHSAGATTSLPLTLTMSGSDFRIEGHPEPEAGKEMIINTSSVSPGYFRTLGVPLMKGRDFSDRDNSDASRTAIINNDLARIYFPSEDPIGKRITFTDGESWISIVGVTADVKRLGQDTNAKPEVYFPYLQVPASSMSLVVRSASEPLSLVTAVKSQIQMIDKDLPLDDAESMQQILSDSNSGRRFNMLLLTVFAMVALVLAIVGIYGVMSYTVTQRTHEIGIRVAIGAQSRDVFRMVIGQGMMLALIGVAFGLAGALALTRLMTTMLFGVEPTDPVTFVSIAVLLTAVALVACYIPGRRATKVNPIEALRYE